MTHHCYVCTNKKRFYWSCLVVHIFYLNPFSLGVWVWVCVFLSFSLFLLLVPHSLFLNTYLVTHRTHKFRLVLPLEQVNHEGVVPLFVNSPCFVSYDLNRCTNKSVALQHYATNWKKTCVRIFFCKLIHSPLLHNFFGYLWEVRDRRPCKMSKTSLSHDYHLIFIPGLGCAH